jgi:hypothetical protein
MHRETFFDKDKYINTCSYCSCCHCCSHHRHDAWKVESGDWLVAELGLN